jgi:hypothetical protein
MRREMSRAEVRTAVVKAVAAHYGHKEAEITDEFSLTPPLDMLGARLYVATDGKLPNLHYGLTIGALVDKLMAPERVVFS